jgi:DNA-binding response OmpR family regulator
MPKKILIVDDEADIQKLVGLRLRKAGYDVEVVGSGLTAIEVIRDQKPDLVLLDLRLPGVDGFKVCRQIKEDPALKHISVIIFTAVHPETVPQQIRLCQADDFILKPFQSEDLLERIRQCLGEAPGAPGE